MKKLTLIRAALITATLLKACGGAGARYTWNFAPSLPM